MTDAELKAVQVYAGDSGDGKRKPLRVSRRFATP
jgi:hypothetical protein